MKLPATAYLAYQTYQERRQRDDLFRDQAGLFAEPAWDLLLDLYVAHYQQGSISISSACIAARVPQTSGLRYIATLVRRGMVRREPDPFDARRVYLFLMPDTVAALDRYFTDQLEKRGDSRVAPIRADPPANVAAKGSAIAQLEKRVQKLAADMARLADTQEPD